jgi:hypothetical protein
MTTRAQSAAIRIVTLLAIGLGTTFGMPAVAALADSDSYGEPAMGHSMDPDDLEVDAEDLDDLQGHSQDPDDLVAESQDPDDMVADSVDPDTLLAESKDPDDMVGDSTDLGDLRESDGSENAVSPPPALVAEVPPPDPNASATTRAAWRQVGSAEQNLDAINDVYSNMMDSNYPRGERRARIVSERNDAIRAVNRARENYARLRDD